MIQEQRGATAAFPQARELGPAQEALHPEGKARTHDHGICRVCTRLPVVPCSVAPEFGLLESLPDGPGDFRECLGVVLTAVGGQVLLFAPRGRVTRQNARPDTSAAFVVDSTHDAVFAVDLTSGDRTVISSTVLGSGPDLIAPESIALDSENDRVLVADTGNDDVIVSVDLSSGDRSVLTGRGAGLRDPEAVALDTADNILYLGDGVLRGVVAINLAPGAEADRALVSR